MNVNEFELEKKVILDAKKNISSFDVLYNKYYPIINSFVFHRVNNEYLRQEIVSQTFIKAMKKLHQFRFFDSRKTRFSSWLIKIAMNEINTYYRNVKKMNDTEVKISDEKSIREGEEQLFPIDYERVKYCMQYLSNEDQNLLALRYFEKKSIKQLCEIFSKKESAMKVKLHRIIKKLKQQIQLEVL